MEIKNYMSEKNLLDYHNQMKVMIQNMINASIEEAMANNVNVNKDITLTSPSGKIYKVTVTDEGELNIQEA